MLLKFTLFFQFHEIPPTFRDIINIKKFLFVYAE
jgi:hypothetical protein